MKRTASNVRWYDARGNKTAGHPDSHASFVKAHAAQKRAFRAGASSHQKHLNREATGHGAGGIGGRVGKGGFAHKGRHVVGQHNHDPRMSAAGNAITPLGGPRTAEQNSLNALVTKYRDHKNRRGYESIHRLHRMHESRKARAAAAGQAHLNREWDETKHPRQHGKFAHK